MKSLFIDSKAYLTSDARNIVDNVYNIQKRLEPDDILWQHMRLEHFKTLIEKQALYFQSVKGYGSTGNVERSPILSLDGHIDRRSSEYSFLSKVFSNFNGVTYISCWYHNTVLVDGVFKRFTRNKENAKIFEGIAIRTSLAKLLSAFTAIADVSFRYSLFYGLLSYVPESLFKLNSSVCEKKDGIDAINMHIPYYYKNTNWSDEMECRFLVRKIDLNNGRLFPYEKGEPKQPEKYINLPISIPKVIDQVAMPMNQLPKQAECMREWLSSVNIILDESETAMDGYVAYDLKQKE